MNRIRQLREKKELTQRKFVTEFNSYLVSDKNKYKDERGVKPVTFGTASRWENDLNQPTESMWNALADFFNVSVPYLQGIDERIYNLKFPTKQEAIDFIHQIMKAQNIKLEDITDESKR